MSDESTPKPNEAPAADPVQNLKAEMNRKMGNLEQTNAQLLAMLQEMKTASAPQQQGAPQKKLSELILDDTDQAVEIITSRVTESVNKVNAERDKRQAKFNQVATELYREYPEVQNEAGELMTRAKEIHATLGDDEKASPLAMKAAVAQAASEMGIKPKSKRNANPETEQAEGFTTGGSRPAGPGKPKSGELDASVEFWAKHFPQYIKLDDKDTRERLKTQHGRKSYSKWA